jgi:type II secretory pathway pseudopilin PulG
MRIAPSTVSAGHRRSGAFTLLELLVVIGIIVLLLAVSGIAVAGRAGEGAALANAQTMLTGLINTTRAQAAVHQTRARLVVYAQQPPGANADSAKYLRSLVVVREDPVDSGRYVAVGDAVTLPSPVCIVPPSPVPTNHLGLPAGQAWNNNVATGPVSTLLMLTSFNYRGQSSSTALQFFGVNGQTGRVFYLEFSPDGTVTSSVTGTPTKIALATAVLAANAPPRFNNASGVRGLFIRKSGAISLVDNATAF